MTTIVNPVAPPPSGSALATRKIGSLQGKRIAVLNNRWQSMDIFAAEFQRMYRQQGAVTVEDIEIPISKAAPKQVLDRVAGDAAFAIVGLAN